MEAESLYKSPDYSPSYDFPYNPDDLVGGNDYSIYDEMMDDDQVKAVISIKKDMVINTGWKIECEKEDVKNYITKALRDINADLSLNMSFEDSLRDILSAYTYGFSLTEPVYILKNGQWTWRCLKTRPPHTFLFEIDDKGNVLEIVQRHARGQARFKPNKFLHHVYQQEFGNPFGKSDLRAAHDPWKTKKFVTRFFAMYLERYAQPTIAGKYKPTMDPNEVRRVFDVLKQMQTNTILVFPEDMMVDLIHPERDSSDAYIKAIDLFNMQIARSILVPDLLGIGGTATKGGSYALGKEQFKLFLGTIYKDRQSLERKITLKLVMPLVQMNFGEIPCEFKFIEYTEDDISAYADLWIKAVSGKIFEPNDEEVNHLRAITGFPEGPVNRPEPEPLPEIMPEEDGKSRGAILQKSGAKPKDSGRDQDENDLSMRTFREKTAHEKKIDFTSIKEVLDTSEEEVTPALLRAARQITSDYVAQVKAKGIVRDFKPEKVNALEPHFLKDMNLVFRNHFRSLFRNSIGQAAKEIFPNGSKATRFTEALLPEEFEEALSAESFKIVGEFADLVKKKSNTLLLEGIKAGRTEAEIVEAIKELLSDATEAWVATVVRTKTTDVYNQARRSYWENDELAKQVVTAYQFSAIIDNRTSDICRHLDQKIFEIGDDIDRVTPPLHFNCRSLLVPVTKFEDFKTSKIPTIDKINDLGGGLKAFGKSPSNSRRLDYAAL